MKNVTVIPEDDDKCEIFTAWVSPGVLKCCTFCFFFFFFFFFKCLDTDFIEPKTKYISGE